MAGTERTLAVSRGSDVSRWGEESHSKTAISGYIIDTYLVVYASSLSLGPIGFESLED